MKIWIAVTEIDISMGCFMYDNPQIRIDDTNT